MLFQVISQAATAAECNCLDSEMTLENNLTFGRIFRDFRTLILHISGLGIFCHLHIVLSTLKTGKL